MKHALRRSFRNRLFAAMLAGSLIPLLLCTFLMAHITRIRMDEAAVDDVRSQTEILLDSLNAISLRLGNAAETLRAAPAVRSAITVTADFSGNGTFRIVVTDNGSGFPEQMLGRPYRGDKSLAKGHLGLYNVDTILRRYYGEECGLYLSAGENGTGAAVTVTLPVRYEEETEC